VYIEYIYVCVYTCIFIRDRTKCGVEWICGADLNGDNLWINNPICRSVITVGLRLGLGLLIRVRNMVRVSIRLGLALGLGLLIVIYKLLEKVTKCGSIT